MTACVVFCPFLLSCDSAVTSLLLQLYISAPCTSFFSKLFSYSKGKDRDQGPLVIKQPTMLDDLVKIVVCVSSVKMASASASVDSKAELTALLEQWEREQQGSTQELVNILTKSVLLPE